MRRAIYPGSFDPITLGHLDLIERALKITDELIVGVLNNNSKKALFTPEERVEMIKEVTSHLPNVKVVSFGGLLVDFAKEMEADVIVRGLRAVTDFEYELQMSQINNALYSEVDTVFLTTRLNYAYLSSTITKEVAMMGGDISKFVPPAIVDKVYDKYKKES
ncbi:MAG: pantetheine-phosphate adenylyltransferase [Lachnospiraceae bacterium]|nr:pantetheine-phosphate adenylyltransferase [Lachnospiraceae bacterium]